MDPVGSATGWSAHTSVYTEYATKLTTPFARQVAGLVPRTAKRVLDVACGPGLGVVCLAQAFASDVYIDALDFSSGMVERARAEVTAAGLDEGRVTVVEGNALALPYLDETFDAVVSNFGVGIMPAKDRKRAILEAARVLKPDGVLLFSSWCVGEVLGVDAIVPLQMGAMAAARGDESLPLAPTRRAEVIRAAVEASPVPFDESPSELEAAVEAVGVFSEVHVHVALASAPTSVAAFVLVAKDNPVLAAVLDAMPDDVAESFFNRASLELMASLNVSDPEEVTLARAEAYILKATKSLF